MLGFKFKKQNTIRQEEYLEKQAKRYPKVLFYIFLVYFILFAIYLGCYISFVNNYELSEVYGQSMQNTLNPNTNNQDECHDLVYININKQPQRFDIVVVRDNFESKQVKLIKRAIGMPGDLVTIVKDETDGYYHVYYAYEGQDEVYKLNEDYVKSYYEWSLLKAPTIKIDNVIYEDEFYTTFIASGNYITHSIGGMIFIEVPEDSIFYLGDNRARSSDSRVRGVGKLSDVEGVAEILLPDAGKKDADVFGIKFKAIFSFIWKNLTNYFAR